MCEYTTKLDTNFRATVRSLFAFSTSRKQTVDSVRDNASSGSSDSFRFEHVDFLCSMMHSQTIATRKTLSQRRVRVMRYGLRSLYSIKTNQLSPPVRGTTRPKISRDCQQTDTDLNASDNNYSPVDFSSELCYPFNQIYLTKKFAKLIAPVRQCFERVIFKGAVTPGFD